MHILKRFCLSILLLCGLTLSFGCGNKAQSVNEDAQDDLFVELKEFTFPARIETLALGDMAGYQGERIAPTSRRARAKRKRISSSQYAESISRAASDPTLPKSRRQLLKVAQSALGTPYVLGGTRPGGFDCSGLVCWAYGNAGVRLPRTAREQSTVGTRIGRLEDMRAGDIVAFRHPRRGYHTGIYVGNGKFIHSPRTGSHVKINSLADPYFNNTFLGARRVNMGSRENLLAQAEQRLMNDASPSWEESRVSRNASRERMGNYEKAQRIRKSIAKRHAHRYKERDRDVLVTENHRSKKLHRDKRDDIDTRKDKKRTKDRKDLRAELKKSAKEMKDGKNDRKKRQQTAEKSVKKVSEKKRHTSKKS